MRHHPIRFLLIGLFTAALMLQAAAVSPGAAGSTERITDIQVKGLRRVSPESVMAQIRLRPGDVLSPRAVDEDIRRLDRMGAFDPTQIRARREPWKGGARLVFEVVERPIIRRIEILGNRVFSAKDLLKEVGLREGQFLDYAREKESTDRIRERYREKRYTFIEVKRQEEVDRQNNTVDIAFVINEGPRVTLSAIRFEGNQAFSDDKLMQLIETRKKKWLFFRTVFDDSMFQLDVARLRNHYKQNGYLDAVVTGETEYSPDKTSLAAVFRITEGPQYAVGDVTIRGNKIVTGAELRRDMKLTPGAGFGSDDYRHDLETVRTYYTSRGYLDVKIDAREVFPQEGRIDLVFDITENQPSRLGLLEVRGNYKTRDKVVRREFDLYPGDVFDETKVARGERRLAGLRYFTDVQTSIVEGEVPDERNLIVEVEEGRTGTIGFAAGVSSNYGLIGQFQVELNNFDITDWPKSFDDLISGGAFVGAGQQLRLLVAPGTEYSRGQIYFADPHVFDSPYGLSTDFFLWEWGRDDYDEGHLGAKIGLSRRWTDRFTTKLTWRTERVKVNNIDTLAPDVLAVSGTSHVASLALGGSYDGSDSAIFPSKGYRVNAELEVAGDYLGSDYNFVKAILGGKIYRTLAETRDGRKHLLTFGGRIGAVDAYGGDSRVPIFERFYSGGQGYLRGFSYRGVGPRQMGTEVGGEFMAVGTVEYGFPIYQTVVQGRQFEMIRGVVFCDVGQIAYRLSDIGDTTWRMSVGAGLRLRVPALGGVPISLDFGFPVNKDDDDDTQVFSFSLSSEF